MNNAPCAVTIIISCFLVLFLFISSFAVAQTPTTDPVEAQALSSILKQWKKPANTKQWNTTGDPCSGKAIGDSVKIDNTDYNPFIKCDCSYDSNTTCHITAFKVYAIDAVGVLPDELWSLVYLTNLIVGQNFLTGPLSAGIGNLTQMQYLDFGTNALSGPLPKELGLLTELKTLGIGSNDFSGPLPSELGNLEKLEELYFGSSGVSGPIPSTFANLQNLKKLGASDTEITGPIPKFIGSWSQLIVLRFEGTSLTGPIPSSFSNLTSLEELRISGLSNSKNSLDFVTSLTSLKFLTLKNNNITGSIPSGIGQLQSLETLDLSFNSITGRIPDSVFSLTSLSYVFLGNNKLTGSLPVQKSSSLINIDVSHNQLSGSFPPWISQADLQLNIIANNFSVTGSNSRALPSGSMCMQNIFPCYRGSNFDFAVKCGGPAIKASNGVLYEKDDEELGSATYRVYGDKWAVSNVGLFFGNSNATDTFNSPRQFTSLNTELFQTTRLSAGSLRYYGIGLENGKYSVLLQFAEIQFDDGKTWRSLGRRVFDIYILGSRVEKDFNIREEAGGKLFTPVKKNYTVQVTANYIEIHLFWAGKGTCCIPLQGTYGPSISALSVTPLFTPKPVSPSNDSKTVSPSNDSKTAVILGVVVAVVVIALLSLAGWWFINRRMRLRATQEELQGLDAKVYSYAELRSATRDFHSSNKLGEGGFGPVFKGTLSDGRPVAVKLLSVASPHGKDQFIAEIATISTVQHRNLVKLYGCCIEGEKRLLVYEYMENKSLDQALFGDNALNLNWANRFQICLGVASGLSYLHQDSSVRIVHRDVKASNILLDAKNHPRISDFGLAKLYDDKKTHISTRVAGTTGYLAPEYAMRGHLTEKIDVFGFGIVALEIVSGRPNSDSTLGREKIYLLDWAWHLHETNQDIDLVDKRLLEYNEDQVKRVISVALLCTQTAPGHRPTMHRALAMLNGDSEVGTIMSKPTYLADWTFDDNSFLTSDTDNYRPGYSSTSQSTATRHHSNES